jgi:hypothetical protein
MKLLRNGRKHGSAADEPEADFRRQGLRERIEVWVNEGGAGGDDESRAAVAPTKGETRDLDPCRSAEVEGGSAG